MQYFGGKARIAKDLSLFLNSQLKPNQPFVDLFCGSCNIISQIESNRIRIANDINTPIVALYEYVQKGGELPDIVTYEQYQDVLQNKHTDKYPEWYKGFVGFGCSFAGKYFGGYARRSKGQNSEYNFASAAKKGIIKKIETMQGVYFQNQQYASCEIPPNSIVYCDIPYFNTTQYSSGEFDHCSFYNWVEKKKTEGHIILISEYQQNTPNGFEVVFVRDSKKAIRDKNNQQVKTTEVLIKSI